MRVRNFSRLATVILAFVLTTILAIFVTTHEGAANEALASDSMPAHTTNLSDSSDSSDTDPSGASSASGNTAQAEASPQSVPVYVPPRRGQPRARVGGGVRGTTAKLPTLQALVPDHVALTAKAQPTLLWHLDQLPPDRASLMFSLTSEEEIDPMIAVVLARPAKPGLQRIDLSGYAFRLETGQEYQWSVALVTDIDHRSRDLITFGWIERVEEPPPLGTRRVTPAGTDITAFSNASVLAAAGLWYDAVDVANGTERAALLEQIGLPRADAR